MQKLIWATVLIVILAAAAVGLYSQGGSDKQTQMPSAVAFRILRQVSRGGDWNSQFVAGTLPAQPKPALLRSPRPDMRRPRPPVHLV